MQKLRTIFALAIVAATGLAIVACSRAEQASLDQVQDLGPFEEFAEYKTVVQNLEPGKRHIYTETPKLVVVLRSGLTKPELDRIAAAYMHVRPGTEIDFFDSKDRLDNYVNLDSYDPRSNYETEMTLDDDFKVKHLKARVREVSGKFEASTDPYVPYGLKPKV